VVNATTFNVGCRVSGGVTGTRESLLKSNGVIQEFATRDEAQAKVDHLMRQMNNEHSVAVFKYWVEPR
jgi:hypothetical protein